MPRPDRYRVVWDEGMLLTPQHFQQSDRHLDEVLRRRLVMLMPHGHGFTALEHGTVDDGEFRLSAAAGILPNGYAFDAPSVDELPQGRRFSDRFADRTEPMPVYLAMPTHDIGGIAVSDTGIDGNRPTPFVRHVSEVGDEARSGTNRKIATARPNLRLLFEGEVLTGHEVLQIAQIRKSGGKFELDPFVPRVLCTAASPLLQRMLGALCTAISNHIEPLANRIADAKTTAGMQAMWLLHTLNGALPDLLHLQAHGRSHPEQLFLVMSRLAAQLCTFAGREHPKKLPAYDHLGLTETFTALNKKLNELLIVVIADRCIPVELKKESATRVQTQVLDETMLAERQFYLSFAADMPAADVIALFPTMAKVSSHDGVDEVLMDVGLPLEHVPKPPDEVPTEPGRIYFHLGKAGPQWNRIKTSRTIAVHVPVNFTGWKLDLLAAKPKDTAPKAGEKRG